MVDENSINTLISFVHNLEDKLISVKIVHEKLYEFMSIVSKTHQTILDDLKNIKNILNQTNIQQEEDELVLKLTFFFFILFSFLKE